MRAWWPAIAAFVLWNATFDYQLRAAGDSFVTDQLLRRQRGEPPVLINDGFRPAVGHAALVSSGLAGLVLAGGLAQVRRRARRGEG